MLEVSTREISTVCSYCGTGCGLVVQAENNKIVRAIGDKNARSSRGETCIKGSQGWGYVHSPKRINYPMIRKNGNLEKATWEEALHFVADKFQAIKDKYGQHSLTLFSSSRSTNELNFLAQKFMRQVIGTNNIDSCNRP